MGLLLKFLCYVLCGIAVAYVAYWFVSSIQEQVFDLYE